MLEVELPDVLRLEYKLEVIGDDGNSDWILDPGNPRRTPGAFGDKSVLELPGYTPPAVAGRADDPEPLRRVQHPRPGPRGGREHPRLGARGGRAGRVASVADR